MANTNPSSEARKLENSAFHRLLGKKLKAARVKAGLSQEETARLVGINRAYLSQLECGKRSVSLILACRLAQVLEFSLDSLMEKGEGENDL